MKLWGAWTQLCFPTNTICLVTSYLCRRDWQVTSASRWPRCYKLTPLPSVIYLAFISSNLAPNIQDKKKGGFAGSGVRINLWSLKCCTEKLSLSTPMVFCSPSPARFCFPAWKTRNKPSLKWVTTTHYSPQNKSSTQLPHSCLGVIYCTFFSRSCLGSAQFLLSIHIPGEIQASFFNHFIIFFIIFSSPGLRLHLCCWESGAQQSCCSESSVRAFIC